MPSGYLGFRVVVSLFDQHQFLDELYIKLLTLGALEKGACTPTIVARMYCTLTALRTPQHMKKRGLNSRLSKRVSDLECDL